MIQHDCCAVEEQGENGWAGDACPAAAHAFEKRDDTGHVWHEIGQPEEGDEVDGDEASQD